jgi:hypothetical protein
MPRSTRSDAARAKQQMLAATIDAVDGIPAMRPDADGNRPARAPVVQVHPDDAPARHTRRDCRACRPDFLNLGREEGSHRRDSPWANAASVGGRLWTFRR